MNPSATSITIYAMWMRRCELESPLVQCFCNSWPVYRNVINEIRGNEEAFFKLICGCQADPGSVSSSGMDLAIAFGTSVDVALYVSTLLSCGSDLSVVCCVRPYWRVFRDWVDSWGRDSVDDMHRFLCACGTRTPPPITTASPAPPPPVGAPPVVVAAPLPPVAPPVVVPPGATCDLIPADSDSIIDKESR